MTGPSSRPTSQLVSVILASSAGVSIVVLTVAALFDAATNPNAEISTQYASLLTGTLGVLVGALAGAIGGRRDEHAPPADPSPLAPAHRKDSPRGN